MKNALNPWPHIKTCPHCGHDEFFVAKTWSGTERFSQTEKNQYRKESVHQQDEGYILVKCDNCDKEIGDVDDLWIQPSNSLQMNK